MAGRQRNSQDRAHACGGRSVPAEDAPAHRSATPPGASLRTAPSRGAAAPCAHGARNTASIVSGLSRVRTNKSVAHSTIEPRAIRVASMQEARPREAWRIRFVGRYRMRQPRAVCRRGGGDRACRGRARAAWAVSCRAPAISFVPVHDQGTSMAERSGCGWPRQTAGGETRQRCGFSDGASTRTCVRTRACACAARETTHTQGRGRE